MVQGDKEKKSDFMDHEELEGPRGDPEMAPRYLRLLLPVFCSTFQSTMLTSIR